MDEQQAEAQQVTRPFATGRGPDRMPPPVPCPPRPWADCGIEEKVNRLREAIQSLHSWKQWSTSATLSFEENIARFINHSHDAAGQAVVPFRPRYDGAGVAQKDQSAHDPLA